MTLHSCSPKTYCRKGNFTTQLLENSLFDFYNSIHVVRNNLQHTFCSVENQEIHYEKHCFVFFQWTSNQAHLKQNQKWRLHIQICRKTFYCQKYDCARYFSFCGKSRRHNEKQCGIVLWLSSIQAHLKQLDIAEKSA